MIINTIAKKVILCFFLAIVYVSSHSYGISFISPSDQHLRVAIIRLEQGGYITTPTTTWPLVWETIEADILSIDEKELEKTPDLSHAYQILIKQYERQKKRHTGSLSSGIATYPLTHYFKDDRVRNYGQLNASYQFYTQDFSTRVSVLTEVNENQTVLVWPDDSYIAGRIGNYAMTFGAENRFWGPGKESALLMSNNAHAIPSFSFKRIKSTPFSHPYLKWLGPWDFLVMFGQLEQNRHIPNAQFFGNRLSFKPHAQLEIGLSRAAQWGGQGRNTNLTSFGNMLIGNDHTGHPVDSNRGLTKETEPGNQMAGFDLKFNTTLNSFPTTLYGEFIGEDSISRFDLIPQPFKFLQLYGVNINLPKHIDIFYEYANTITRKILTYHTYGSSSYNNGIYQSGYRYYGETIGHTNDSNSASYSLGLKHQKGNHSFSYINRKIFNNIAYTSALETNNKDRILAKTYTLQQDFSYEYSRHNKHYFYNILLDRYENQEGKRTYKIYTALGMKIRF